MNAFNHLKLTTILISHLISRILTNILKCTWALMLEICKCNIDLLMKSKHPFELKIIIKTKLLELLFYNFFNPKIITVLLVL